MLLISCSNDGAKTDGMVKATFNFIHHWDNTIITNANFNTVHYTTANGEELSIERLRYLISNITFEKPDGETIRLEGHNLIDVTNGTNLSFTPNESIPIGDYTNVSFTFGFTNEDNIDGEYIDLNSASWNVPTMLGGGYHYMQLEGKFIDDTATETGYQYHVIRAVDTSGAEIEFQDTFFQVDLGLVTISDTVAFEISMNVAEWFKNPNQWELNELHSMLMPNFGAQIMMSQNGKMAFSLDRIRQ